MITGLIFKSDAVKRMAFLIYILGSLTSVAAMTSGEVAEGVVENISGVTVSYIDRHEDSAKLFSILTYILGGFSIVGLWAGFKQKKFADIINLAVLVFACVVIYFGKAAGTTGGEIRHTEIRADNKVTPATKNQSKIEEDDN